MGNKQTYDGYAVDEYGLVKRVDVAMDRDGMPIDADGQQYPLDGAIEQLCGWGHSEAISCLGGRLLIGMDARLEAARRKQCGMAKDQK